MSELKRQKTSLLNMKNINQLGHSEVSEDIYHGFVKNKKKIIKGRNTTETAPVTRLTKNP